MEPWSKAWSHLSPMVRSRSSSGDKTESLTGLLNPSCKAVIESRNNILHGEIGEAAHGETPPGHAGLRWPDPKFNSLHVSPRRFLPKGVESKKRNYRQELFKKLQLDQRHRYFTTCQYSRLNRIRQMEEYLDITHRTGGRPWHAHISREEAGVAPACVS